MPRSATTSSFFKNLWLLTTQQEPDASEMQVTAHLNAIRGAIASYKDNVEVELDASLRKINLENIRMFEERFEAALQEKNHMYSQRRKNSSDIRKALTRSLEMLRRDVEGDEQKFLRQSEMLANEAEPLNRLGSAAWLSAYRQWGVSILPPGRQMQKARFYMQRFGRNASTGSKANDIDLVALYTHILNFASADQRWLLEDHPDFKPAGDKAWRKSEDPIGTGSGGQVFLASVFRKSVYEIGETAERSLAVKIMRCESESELKRLERRCKALTQAAARHPHVVAFVGHQSLPSESRYHIFMEYTSGHTLHTMLDHVTITETEARPIVRQIAAGLQHLHVLGFVHQDLKGDNILVTLGGCMKIADLDSIKDMSRPLSEIAQEKAIGTVHWMSPEAAAGHTSARSDVWSLGCLIIEILTKTKPWCYEKEWEPEPLSDKLIDMYNTELIDAPPIDLDFSKKLKLLLSAIFVSVEARVAVPGVLESPWIKDIVQTGNQGNQAAQLQENDNLIVE